MATPRSEVYAQILSGRVDSVDKDRHTVKVAFEHVDGFISYDLQLLAPFGGDYCLPTKDTPVLCAILDGRLGVGWVLGTFYTDADKPPLSDAGQRAIAGNDLRLGAPDASDKVALAPATKDQIQKAVDFADGICTAIRAGAPAIGFDGGAALKASIVAALPVKPTIDEPKAEKVSAK